MTLILKNIALHFFIVNLFIMISSVCVFAQSPLLNQTNEQEENYISSPSHFKNNSRQFVSEWYNYGRTIKNGGGNCQYYKNYLFPDSTVKANFSNDVSGVWKHSYGEVCDPSSPALDSNTLIGAFASYTLDSIALQYKYFRFQNQAPDTLVFQIYKNDRIDFFENPFNDSRSMARVNYNYLLRKGDTSSYEFTVLLSNNDTSTINQSTMYLPVGLSINAGQKVAAVVTYYPGNAFSIGDTIDPNMQAVNRINAFAIYDFKDFDNTYNKYFFNNGLLATNEVRYNYDTLGWNGKFIPGTAYSNGYYHLDMSFKLSSNYVGLNNLMTSDIKFNLFPSVVSENENSILQIQSNKNQNAEIKIVDLSGKNIYEFSTALQTGTTKISLPVNYFNSGIYLVIVSVNGMKGIKKLIKI